MPDGNVCIRGEMSFDYTIDETDDRPSRSDILPFVICLPPKNGPVSNIEMTSFGGTPAHSVIHKQELKGRDGLRSFYRG